MRYIIFLLIFITSLLYAKQDKFFIVIPKPFDSVLYDVTQDYDNTVSAVGFSNEYKNVKHSQTYTSAFDYLRDSSDNLYGKKPILVTINQYGDITLEKFAKINAFSEAVAVVKTPQNGYFVGGYTFNGELLLAKLDSYGNTIFVKKFGTKNYDRMNTLVPLSDGGVLAVGNSTTSRDIYDPMFRTGLGLNDIFLTRFDKNGNMLWSKKYGTQYDDMGIDAKEAYDGSIVVIAATTYDKNKDVTLMRIGENGDKIWLKHFHSTQLQTPKRLISLLDHTFLAVLTQKDEMQKDQIRLIKFDLEKNVLVDNLLSTYYPSEIEDIAEYANSTLIGVGKVKDRFNTDALVMILDENLEILCQEHYGSDSYDIFYGVKILHDSKAMAVGVTTPKNMQMKNMVFAKIKQDCTLAPKPKKIQQKNPFEKGDLHFTKQYSSIFDTKQQIAMQQLAIFNTPKKIKKEKNVKNYYQLSPKKPSLKDLQTQLYQELKTSFKNLLQAKKITLLPSLKIILSEPTLYFQQGSYTLLAQQKKFLQQFIHKLLPLLEQYKNDIVALEISGHTSSEWERGDSFTKRYVKNSDLALKRALSVSNFLIQNVSTKKQQFLSKLLKDSGYSFSKTILQDNKEDKFHSRRVEFSIILRKN